MSKAKITDSRFVGANSRGQEHAVHEESPGGRGECAGFLLSDSAQHNLIVRLKQRKGALDLAQVKPTKGVRLFRTYRAMAVANGVPADDEVLKPCR